MNMPQILSGGVQHPWRRAAAAVLRRLTPLLDTALRWHEHTRQRRHLRFLSDAMLRDIGLSRADVQAETSKPFWRA